VRFWVSFDCDLLDIVRRRRREQDNQPAFDQAQDSLSSDSEIYTVNPWLDNSLQDPLMRTLISEALAGLPDIIRQAFVLKYYAGYPEESDKHEKGATIASMLNVSGRTVRNYLMRAEEHLARWRDGLVLNPKSSKRSQEYGR
jgi:DNA-directed RNA polymerase specialized sigma24 family protein